jgi:CubicO group peptidase (beta-lactamase class C family)
MGRTLESLHRTLANGFQVRAVCNVSLGHRFHVSNKPVKNPPNCRQQTTVWGSITSLLALTLTDALGPLPSNRPLAGTWQTVYLAGMTPLVEWVSLASPIDIRSWWEGQTWEVAIRLPWGLSGTRIVLNSGLAGIYVVSLALHAMGTVVLMRATAWLFDCGRDGARLLSRLLRGGRRP